MDEKKEVDGVIQVADQGVVTSDTESELSGDCMGEGFSQSDMSEDDERDELNFAALTLEVMSANEPKTRKKTRTSKQTPKDKIDDAQKRDKSNRTVGKKIDVSLQQTVINVQNPTSKQHMTV